MLLFTRRRMLIGSLAAVALTEPAVAAPRRYRIAPEEAEIRFVFTANGTTQTGTAPLSRADLIIDPQNLRASTAEVTANVRAAKAGLPIITRVMKGPEMLDTARHPTAYFRSTGVRLGASGRLSDGAVIEGHLTLKGVTRPVSLAAAVYRPVGTAPDDLDRLEARLSARISRSSFGISGYPELVADTVGLDIRARIQAVR